MSSGSGSQGLRGVAAGRTALCTVGDGHDLYYLGYPIGELVEKCSFEEVAHLLTRGSLPTKEQLDDYTKHIASMREIDDSVKRALELVPASAHPMDACRVAASQIGVARPEASPTPEEARKSAERMLACMPTAIAHWHRVANGKEPVSSSEPTLAGSLLEMFLGSAPDADKAKAMDTALILYAEHEFNASTFAARVVTATRSDFHSAITAAIGALKGPLHGGANEAAMALVEKFDDPAKVPDEIRRMLREKELIMGFGHAVYKSGDPRSPIIKEVSRKLSAGHAEEALFAISEAIETTMREEKNIEPNLDFYAATTFRYLGMPTPIFTPIFVCSRLSGWGAHVIEQRVEGKLIRPGAEYFGPEPRPVPDISDRANIFE